MTAETERLTYSTTEYRFMHMQIVCNMWWKLQDTNKKKETVRDIMLRLINLTLRWPEWYDWDTAHMLCSQNKFILIIQHSKLVV